ncbi:complex I NDUFA9 subunit family protein [Chrysiogenes arsenatis]|uniref:complex I NDUFA9 subunit family protein n=1 Tax=Chrysiogenes arsenatis TaxID=309797 RepID=UPI000428E63C|nr:complex I NDUFA9 subunit family protein [Chrysiogenes arsenatis]
MQVAIIGGTGFVGSHVTRAVLDAGHTVSLLVRSTGTKVPAGVTSFVGDISDTDSLARLCQGADAVIYLVGIIREFPPVVTYKTSHVYGVINTISAMKRCGVTRLLHMSALGSEFESPSGYLRTKYDAEIIVRQSSLTETIFKPSVIFGPGDGFINLLRRLTKLPIVPMIGDGHYPLQPVSVYDIAAGFAAALTTPAMEGKCYEIGGPTVYAYRDLLDTVARLQGKGVPLKVPQPIALMRLLATLFGKFAFFPLTTDQLYMLQKGSQTVDMRMFEDAGIAPQSLESRFATDYT